MIVGFLIGSAFTLFMCLVTMALGIKYGIKKGWFTYASYCEKEKEWTVRGKFSKIALELADIRQGRKPGAIKYVD